MATASRTCGYPSLHVTKMATTIWLLLIAHLVVCCQLSHEPQMATHNCTFRISSITYYWHLRRHFQFRCRERKREQLQMWVMQKGNCYGNVVWSCTEVVSTGMQFTCAPHLNVQTIGIILPSQYPRDITCNTCQGDNSLLYGVHDWRGRR